MSSRVFLFVCIVCNSDRVQMKKRLYKQVDRKKRVADRSDAVIHIEREYVYRSDVWLFIYLKKDFCCMQSKRKDGSKRVATVWRRTVKSILYRYFYYV